MKIQPANNTISRRFTFGNRRMKTKLPRSLKAKPKRRVPKGFLISLIPISLLGFGIYYWKTHEKEAMKHFWKSDYGQSIIRRNFEQLLRRFGIEIPPEGLSAQKKYEIISMWQELSNAPIQSEKTITLKEAFEKYGVQNKDKSIQESPSNSLIQNGREILLQEMFEKYGAKNECASIQENHSNAISMQDTFLKYVKQSQNAQKMSAEE